MGGSGSGKSAASTKKPKQTPPSWVAPLTNFGLQKLNQIPTIAKLNEYTSEDGSGLLAFCSDKDAYTAMVEKDYDSWQDFKDSNKLDDAILRKVQDLVFEWKTNKRSAEPGWIGSPETSASVSKRTKTTVASSASDSAPARLTEKEKVRRACLLTTVCVFSVLTIPFAGAARDAQFSTEVSVAQS
jgi:hypothetical protein